MNSFQIRIYYEDTDVGGMVYHANYLKFAERGRTELLRTIGIEESGLLSNEGIHFVVRRCQIEFIQPARLDDQLTIITQITGIGAATINFDQVIERQGAKLVVLQLQIACLGLSGRPQRLPSKIRTAFSEVKQKVLD